ncbi:MAG: AMP-binding protein, partial [Candidatus Eremiobacteraeota bacterium]|nr:AMP-binding protein [Candidatus Eremiobacteraeota bacterium]
MMRVSGHVDTFAQERLPEAAAMPQFLVEQLGYPQWMNAATELLDRRAQRDGNRRCILTPSGETWTYERLLDAANRIAAVLVDDLGLEAGNRVLLRAPNTPMLAACWFGVLKAGGIAVTTMPLYRAAELRVMIEKARIRLALCDARLSEELDRACAGTPGIRAIRFHEPESSADSLERRMLAKSGRFEDARTAAEDVALIAFTSGTTGTPKAAMHYHRDILAICDTYCARVLEPRDDDLFAGSPPLGFTFGLGGLLLFPIYAGAATLLLEKAGPTELLEAVANFGVTSVFTAPLAYRAMAGACANYALGSLRSCVSAGETLPKAIWEEWHAKTGIKILDGIGSTEMLHIFVGSPEADARAGSTGRAVPGYVAEIHDENGRPVRSGVVGRLAVKGPTGCKYLEDPRQASYVQNGWNYPGDAYRVDEDGYFWYVAR